MTIPTVTSLDASLYRVPAAEAHDDATQSFDALELVIAEVDCDDGTTGIGFTYTIGEGGVAVHAFLDHTLRPVVEGERAVPRAAYHRMREETTFVGREGISELAVSAVDIALWDALGKRRCAPLYELLGGERERVPAYQTDGGWLQYNRETLVDNAAAAAEAGFAGMKMKIGHSHDEDEARIRAVRETLPADRDLMVDANCAYTIPEARRLAGHLNDVDIAWLEEPLPKGDYSAYADLRDRIRIPLAAGENYYNPSQFKQAVVTGAIDVLQPDVCRVGGITAWTRVAELGAAWNLSVSPHYIEPIHTHLAAAFDNIPYVERHSTVLDRVVADPVEPKDGMFVPPTDPGCGMIFGGLDNYRVTTT